MSIAQQMELRELRELIEKLTKRIESLEKGKGNGKEAKR